jgi:hypothetical protein
MLCLGRADYYTCYVLSGIDIPPSDRCNTWKSLIMPIFLQTFVEYVKEQKPCTPTHDVSLWLCDNLPRHVNVPDRDVGWVALIQQDEE